MIVSEERENVSSSEHAARVCRQLLRKDLNTMQERMYALGLDAKNSTMYVDMVSLGTLSATLVHPRESFRTAVMRSCAAIIFCHNHPSGDTRPSQEDILLTRRLQQAGDLLGIRVLDHIIINDGMYGDQHYSFRDGGLMSAE